MPPNSGVWVVAKRGRKAKHYVTQNGEVIEGLTRRKNGNWASTTDRNAHFGTKHTPEHEAIYRFRAWQAKRNGSKIEYEIEMPVSPKDGEKLNRLLGCFPETKEEGKRIKQTGMMRIAEEVPENIFWEKVGGILSTNQGRRRAAQASGVKQLEWIDEVKPPADPLPLTAIGELYYGRVLKEPKGSGEPYVFDFANAKKTSHNQRTRVRLAWKEFCNSVAPAKSIAEIDESSIERWGKFLHETIQGAKTLRERIANVQTVLNYARPRHKQHLAEIDRVKLDISALVEKPEEPEANPQPIKPKHFGMALEVASTKWRAALLCALNLALHPKELADLLKKEIDLEDMTFVSNRKKRGRVRRCARLWARTVEAIRAYQQEEPHDSERLFVNGDGKPLNSHSIIDNWKRIRRRAGIPETVQFDSMRDGARTHMSGEGAAIVMGHSLGTADKYKLRMPHDPKVVQAVKDVEEAYFGQYNSKGG